jgi:hypothetical protein
MKLSEQTIEILKNFSTINPNLVFKKGKVLQTITEAKNILASATIQEEFPHTFGIYDLTEFLASLSLVEDPSLSFNESSVSISGGKTSLEYYYSPLNLLTTPQKQVNMPDAEVTFKFTEVLLNKIRRASSVLGHTSLQILGEEGKISLNVIDPKTPSSNKYSVIADENNSCKEAFSFIAVVGNLKMIPGDYTISISSKLISHFKHSALPVDYWMALEKTSTFGPQG